ncbi:hypothetical protein VTI74DRAFT_4387 [Chaetomium olivicolor]
MLRPRPHLLWPAFLALTAASIAALARTGGSTNPTSTHPSSDSSLPSSSPISVNPKDIQTTLLPLLSPTAVLILSTSPSSGTRWSSSPLNSPHQPLAIILPTTASDIAATIRYANAHDLPFLATTGGHGTTTTLSAMEGGIIINMRNMTSFSVSPDRKTATIGGGLLAGNVVDELWAVGLQTTTGLCGCVSFAGPALGGGHGLLQGRYGLVADQVLAAEMVLADGSVVRVGERERGNLFWGLRGAGHNFGVVSEFTVRVHEVEEGRREWAWEGFTFEGGRLEKVYEVLGGMMEGQGDGVVFWSFWQRVVDVDPVKPVIVVYVLHNGPLEEAREYTRLIHALSPTAYRFGVTDYPGLQAALGTDKNGPFCQPQGTIMFRGFDVNEYDLVALREWFSIFTKMLETEEAFAHSFCMLEGYPVQGVQAVHAESTAFPHRGQRLSLAPVIVYDDVGNKTLDKEAESWIKEMEVAAFGNARWRTYVNYAHGDETPQAMYGYEPWRLEKLRVLKRKYDPDNRFRFYNPIVGGSRNR